MQNHNYDVAVWYFIFTNKKNTSGKSDMSDLLALGKDNDPECFEFTVTLPDRLYSESVLVIASGLAVKDGFNKNSRWHLSRVS